MTQRIVKADPKPITGADLLAALVPGDGIIINGVPGSGVDPFGSLLAAGTGIGVSYNSGTRVWTVTATGGGGGGGVSDGDKGDIVVSSSGTVWTIDSLAVTNAKINDVAWSKVTGTPATLSGYGISDAQPLDSDLTAIAALTTTSFGRSLLTQTDAAAARTTLGAGTSSFDGAYSSLSGIPSTFTPASHVHGNISNAGAIGTTANLPIITGASGVLSAGSFGTAAATFCEGNDARLSDARTPLAHNQAWSTITSTPTTLSGYGITDSVALTTGKLSQFAATTSSELAGVISDETGSGALVFATSPTLTTPNIGAATGASLALSGALNFSGPALIGVAGNVTRFSISNNSGGAAIGTYAGQSIEPVNGLRVSGNVIIGKTTDDGARLQVSGNLTTSGTIEVVDALNPKTLYVYNTFTSSTSHELGKLEWASNVFRIGTEKGSAGGSARALEFQTDGTTRLTIGTDGDATVSTNGATSKPSFTLNGTIFTGGSATTTKSLFLIEPTGTISNNWSTSGTFFGINAHSTFTGNLIACYVAGQTRFRVDYFGGVGGVTSFSLANTLNLNVAGAPYFQFVNTGRLSIVSGGSYCFSSSASHSGTGDQDTRISRQSAGVLQVGTTSNNALGSLALASLSAYNTFTDASNYERAKIAWESNVLIIGTEKAGTGSARSLELQTDGTTRLTISTTGAFTIADALNIAVGTTTGTKIGTATNQKLGFFDKTPVVQPTAVADATDAASVITQLNALLSRMRDLGLIAT